MDKEDIVCRIYHSVVSSKANTKDSVKFLKESYFVKGKLNCVNNLKKCARTMKL